MAILAVGLPDELLAELREHMNEVTIHGIDRAGIGDGAPGDVDLVVVGDGERPVRDVQSVYAALGEVLVVIAVPSERVKAVEDDLRFAPLIPADVTCEAVDDGDLLVARLRDAHEMARRRKEHAATVAAVSSRMGEALPRSPGPRYLGRLLELAPIGITTLDGEGRILECNRSLEEIFSLTERDLIGEDLASLFDEPEDVADLVARARGQEDATSETFTRTRGAEQTHVDIRIGSLESSSGDGTTIALLLDVSDRIQAEEARSKTLMQIEFLAEASGELAKSLQMPEILDRLASLCVPRLADWCAVDLVDRDGNARRVLVRHKDPALAGAAVALKRYGPQRARPIPIFEVMASGRPQIIEEMSEELFQQTAQNEEHRQLLEELGVGAVVIAPLEARGRVLGTLLLVDSDRSRSYGAVDVGVAQDLAQRAALALDNARLFQEHRHVARKLQESLLPPSLPEIPGIELAARYQAAGEGIEVGGDFYDFFPLGGSSWGIVIGDVSGKGPEAAGVTALARYTARAAAMQVRSPRRIFTILNDAILTGTGDERFATVAFLRLDTRPQGTGRKLVLSSAGHPLPLVLRAATGEVEEVGDTGTVLGLVPSIEVRDRQVHLEAGDLLLLYTDGVTEARNSDDRLLGVAGTKRLLGECRGRSAREVADHLTEAVLAFQDDDPRDDLAVVVLKVPLADPPVGVT